MTLPEYALDYDTCGGQELRVFLKARTGRTTKKLKQKQYYMYWLLQADKDAIFRFLDLSPELRNLVYGELLHLRSKPGHTKRYCFPRILAASKQVHEEAHGILYGNNIFEVHIRAWFLRTHIVRHVEARCRVDVDSARIGYSASRDLRLDKLYCPWPDWLRKVYQLHVVLTIDYTDAQQDRSTSILQGVNHLLYGIFSFLGAENALKRLKFQVDVSTYPAFDDITSSML